MIDPLADQQIDQVISIAGKLRKQITVLQDENEQLRSQVSNEVVRRMHRIKDRLNVFGRCNILSVCAGELDKCECAKCQIEGLIDREVSEGKDEPR